MANDLERLVMDSLIQVDRRDLPLLSEEEMANRGIFYDESTGVYKNVHPDNVSVTLPGQPTKTFTPDEQQSIRMTPEEIDDASNWQGEPRIYPDEYYPDDMYRRGAVDKRERFGSAFSGTESFGEQVFFPEMGGDDLLLAELLNIEGGLYSDMQRKERVFDGQVVRPGYEGEYTNLATRQVYPFDRSGEMNLHQYQNLARYLEEVIDMPEYNSLVDYWYTEEADMPSDYYEDKSIMGLARHSGDELEGEAKREAINQMINIHLNNRMDDRSLPWNDDRDVYLGDSYTPTEDLSVTDIVSGLADSRDRSEWYGRRSGESLDTARSERDAKQAALRDIYQDEASQWWFGKYLGRANPKSTVSYDEDKNFYRRKEGDY